MELSRRQTLALAGGSLGAVGYGGYRYLEDDSATYFDKVLLRVYNVREETHEFAVAFEFGDGMGEWRTWELGHREAEETILDPKGDRKAVAMHGVVDGHTVVWDIYQGEGKICKYVDFGYPAHGDPEIGVGVADDCDRARFEEE